MYLRVTACSDQLNMNRFVYFISFYEIISNLDYIVDPNELLMF